jgi:hypothetical protein
LPLLSAVSARSSTTPASELPSSLSNGIACQSDGDAFVALDKCPVVAVDKCKNAPGSPGRS